VDPGFGDWHLAGCTFLLAISLRVGKSLSREIIFLGLKAVFFPHENTTLGGN